MTDHKPDTTANLQLDFVEPRDDLKGCRYTGRKHYRPAIHHEDRTKRDVVMGVNTLVTTSHDKFIQEVLSWDGQMIFVDNEAGTTKSTNGRINCMIACNATTDEAAIYHGVTVFEHHIEVCRAMRNAQLCCATYDTEGDSSSLEALYPNAVRMQSIVQTFLGGSGERKISLRDAGVAWQAKHHKEGKVNYEEYFKNEISDELVEYALSDVLVMRDVCEQGAPAGWYMKTIQLGSFNYRFDQDITHDISHGLSMAGKRVQFMSVGQLETKARKVVVDMGGNADPYTHTNEGGHCVYQAVVWSLMGYLLGVQETRDAALKLLAKRKDPS